jgi:hypothetical protein
MSYDDRPIFSHRRALIVWLLVSGAFWIAAAWALASAG